MAPVSKKAKTAAKPTPGGGLNKFFGAAKSGDLAAAAGAAPPAAAPAAPAVATPAPAAASPVEAPAATAAPAPGLTDAQKQRIEENRRKALERQQAKKNGSDKVELPSAATATAAEIQKSPAPLKTLEAKQVKRSSSDITPEKCPMPNEERRISPNTSSVEQGNSGPEDKFRTFGKEKWMQYNKLYTLRLSKLRDAALAQAKAKWSTEVAAANFLPNISSTSGAAPGDVVMIGLTFKDMPSRANVIEQYRDPICATSCLPEDDVDNQPNLCSDADVMWLEDATFRVQLILPTEQIAKLATGFVAAMRGQMTVDGKLDVRDFCFVQGSTSASLPTPLPTLENAAPGPYLALISGLFIGAPDEDTQARNSAIEFLMEKSEVDRIIVCGGVYSVPKMKDGPTGLEDADNIFTLLAQQKAVDVMPGHKDPSNLSMPQMPLHPFLFRSAQKSSHFKSVSNPYECSLGDLKVLGHSGQPIRDLMRCTNISTPMEALTTCLDASLLAPTAPDTLITQPFETTDPFVIDTMPQLLFSGGHDKLEYEYRTPSTGGSGTLCVCVPAFNKNPSVVLVNTRDPRDIRVQEFGTKVA